METLFLVRQASMWRAPSALGLVNPVVDFVGCARTARAVLRNVMALHARRRSGNKLRDSSIQACLSGCASIRVSVCTCEGTEYSKLVRSLACSHSEVSSRLECF